ncbi:MAG: hemolysin III family protein [Streptococcaceae bacterium]|jgi:hemolysin III|nr:hemolysin III family protein [Streptococcaceae bacterium]
MVERYEKRSKGIVIIDETLNAVTHGLGVGFAIWGFLLLLAKSNTTLERVAVSIYSATLILLFLISCLRHALFFTPASKTFQVLDHASIFLLIAGTYTPYCLLPLAGWVGTTILIIVWICAIVGLVVTSVFLPRWKRVPKLATALYVVMGWIILIAMWPLWESMPHTSFWLLIIGGVVYSLGAAIYHYKFPFAHLVWHVFVLAAAFLMWLSIYGILGH